MKEAEDSVGSVWCGRWFEWIQKINKELAKQKYHVRVGKEVTERKEIKLRNRTRGPTDRPTEGRVLVCHSRLSSSSAYVFVDVGVIGEKCRTIQFSPK